MVCPRMWSNFILMFSRCVVSYFLVIFTLWYYSTTGGFGSSTLFGAAVNRAFGSEKASSRQSAGANSGSFLNENGMDIDELNAEVNENQGDYSTRFVDDEEEYVTVEQVRQKVFNTISQFHMHYFWLFKLSIQKRICAATVVCVLNLTFFIFFHLQSRNQVMAELEISTSQRHR